MTLALIINGTTITTLTRADYTLFSCASPASDTTEKQDKYSTVINSWRGVPPPHRRNRVEWKGANCRSKSAVYIYPLRFAGRILRQGRLVRPFFWFESKCSRDFSWSVCFLWFLKKLKCFFTYILYITNAWFAVTLWSVTDRCYKDPTRRVADVKCIKSKSGVNLLYSRRGADVSASTGMAQGERKGSWIDITSHFPGSIWLRGIDISFIDFFILVFEYSF